MFNKKFHSWLTFSLTRSHTAVYVTQAMISMTPRVLILTSVIMSLVEVTGSARTSRDLTSKNVFLLPSIQLHPSPHRVIII